jgi:mRNA-degrading endonuclease RelE of RelBE toxin-antitoxin system
MYRIRLTKKAKIFLRSIEKEEAEIILNEVFSLRKNPFERRIKKLKGYKIWRFKIKRYRAILDILISGKDIKVLTIGYRRNIYKNFFGKK